MPRCFAINRAPALSLLLCVSAVAQKPAPDKQKQTLDAARDIAVHYAASLPNFICTEQVERNDSLPAHPSIDRLTIQLTYFKQKEKYKLVSMNGGPATQTFESLNGLITAGEFGTLQLGIFDPSSAAEFQWKQATMLRKHPVNVYSYRIARAHSKYMIGSRAANGQMLAAAAGYKGEVFLDNETSSVLRLTASADDVPADSRILRSSVQVDYDFIDVSGKQYLLPSRSASTMGEKYRQLSNKVTFVDFKKFEADSTISFK